MESLEKQTAALTVRARSSAFGGAFAQKPNTWSYFVKRSNTDPLFGSDRMSDGKRVIVCDVCPCSSNASPLRLSLLVCLHLPLVA